MGKLDGKVALVTGGAKGMGASHCAALAAEGAFVVVCDVLDEQGAALAQEIGGSYLHLDVTSESDWIAAVAATEKEFGPIDILINNGGMSQRSLTAETPLEIDRKIMEINFFGTIALTKSVLPYMIKQNSGHIIAMSSIAGKFGFYFRSAYAASKHALHGFFESLRMEVQLNNIKVLIVCPGKIKTNISINAITGDGGKHNKMDESQEKGLSAKECARQILSGIKNNKEELFIGGKELRAIWVKRFFPNLFTRLIRKQKPE